MGEIVFDVARFGVNREQGWRKTPDGKR